MEVNLPTGVQAEEEPRPSARTRVAAALRCALVHQLALGPFNLREAAKDRLDGTSICPLTDIEDRFGVPTGFLLLDHGRKYGVEALELLIHGRKSPGLRRIVRDEFRQSRPGLLRIPHARTIWLQE